MRSLYCVLLSSILMSSAPALAREYSTDWTLLPDTAAVQLESVKVSAPKTPTTTRDTELWMFVELPVGCYKTDVQVEHRDDFTHVLKPLVVAANYPCVQVSRFDVQSVNLGRLPVGEHQVLVENVAKPVAPVTFWVSDDESLATH